MIAEWDSRNIYVSYDKKSALVFFDPAWLCFCVNVKLNVKSVIFRLCIIQAEILERAGWSAAMLSRPHKYKAKACHNKGSFSNAKVLDALPLVAELVCLLLKLRAW